MVSNHNQGGENYQQAFYVFEELAQAPATSSIRSLVSQAVAELHLGRTEESQSALEQAMKLDPSSADAIANLLVLNIVSGNDAAELTQYVPPLQSYTDSGLTLCRALKKADPTHQHLQDLEEKSSLFDKAATKYSARVSA